MADLTFPSVTCEEGDIVRISTNQPIVHLMTMFPYGFEAKDFENVEPRIYIAKVTGALGPFYHRMVSCKTIVPRESFVIEPMRNVVGIVSEQELQQILEQNHHKC